MDMATGQSTAKFKLNFGRPVYYIAQSHLLNSLFLTIFTKIHLPVKEALTGKPVNQVYR